MPKTLSVRKIFPLLKPQLFCLRWYPLSPPLLFLVNVSGFRGNYDGRVIGIIVQVSKSRGYTRVPRYGNLYYLDMNVANCSRFWGQQTESGTDIGKGRGWYGIRLDMIR